MRVSTLRPLQPESEELSLARWGPAHSASGGPRGQAAGKLTARPRLKNAAAGGVKRTRISPVVGPLKRTMARRPGAIPLLMATIVRFRSRCISVAGLEELIVASSRLWFVRGYVSSSGSREIDPFRRLVPSE